MRLSACRLSHQIVSDFDDLKELSLSFQETYFLLKSDGISRGKQKLIVRASISILNFHNWLRYGEIRQKIRICKMHNVCRVEVLLTILGPQKKQKISQ